MSGVKRFEELEVWKQAARIAKDILLLTNQDDFKYDFSLKDQVRRSAFSISSNIAEGFEYDNNKEFVRFLKYAKGSAGELRSQLHILASVQIVDLNFYKLKEQELLALSRQISGLMSYLKKYKQNL